MMRLLLLNPNTSEALTARMAAAAARSAPRDVSIHAVTAPRGFPYISNRAEAQIAGAILLETIAANARGVDVAIVAAFGDPGVRAARTLFEFPVLGIAEASIMTAAMFGRRFGIVGFTRRMADWYRDCVLETGMERRFTGFRAPMASPRSAETAHDDLRAELLHCVRDCHVRDGADVVIMAGAPLTGFAVSAGAEAAAPLIDPVAAAVLQAAAAAQMAAQHGWSTRAWSDPKPTTGLDPALAARFLGIDAAPSVAPLNGHAPA